MNRNKEYIESQFKQLKTNSEYKSTIKIVDFLGNQTNYISVSEKQLNKIEQILKENEEWKLKYY